VVITGLTVLGEDKPKTTGTLGTSTVRFDESDPGSSLTVVAGESVSDFTAAAVAWDDAIRAKPTAALVGPDPADLVQAEDEAFPQAAPPSLGRWQSLPAETARIDNVLPFLARARLAKKGVGPTASSVDRAIVTSSEGEGRDRALGSLFDPRPWAVPGVSG
jgi:hypothetical protein